MNASLPAVCSALAAQLAAQIPDVVTSDIVISQPPAPCLFALPETIAYGQAMAGGLESDPTLVVQAIVDMSEGGQHRLYRFMDGSGPDSVAAAIMHDRTLGGLVGQVVVDTCTGPTLANIGGVGYLLAVWSVRVF